MSESSLAVLTSTDARVARVANFLDRVFPAPRSFEVRLWNGEVLPSAGVPEFTIALSSPGSLKRMFRPPVELSLGEAYLRGDFHVEGNMSALPIPPPALGRARAPAAPDSA